MQVTVLTRGELAEESRENLSTCHIPVEQEWRTALLPLPQPPCAYAKQTATVPDAFCVERCTRPACRLGDQHILSLLAGVCWSCKARSEAGAQERPASLLVRTQAVRSCVAYWPTGSRTVRAPCTMYAMPRRHRVMLFDEMRYAHGVA